MNKNTTDMRPRDPNSVMSRIRALQPGESASFDARINPVYSIRTMAQMVAASDRRRHTTHYDDPFLVVTRVS